MTKCKPQEVLKQIVIPSSLVETLERAFGTNFLTWHKSWFFHCKPSFSVCLLYSFWRPLVSWEGFSSCLSLDPVGIDQHVQLAIYHSHLVIWKSLVLLVRDSNLSNRTLKVVDLVLKGSILVFHLTVLFLEISEWIFLAHLLANSLSLNKLLKLSNLAFPLAVRILNTTLFNYKDILAVFEFFLEV